MCFVRAWGHIEAGRFVCVVCGAEFEQRGATMSLFEADGWRVGDVCPECLRVGVWAAGERARAHAELLRERAAWLERLATALPDVAGWRGASPLAELAWAEVLAMRGARGSTAGGAEGEG